MPNNNTKVIRFLATGAIIAAVYAAATYAGAALSYMDVQVRFSEALCVLAVFTPAAVPGLTLGCLISNIGSPLGPVDLVIGTLASLIAALLGRQLRHFQWRGLPLLAPLPAVLVNALMIGGELCILLPLPNGQSRLIFFLICAGQVGLGQFAACYLCGLPLYMALKRTKIKDFL